MHTPQQNNPLLVLLDLIASPVLLLDGESRVVFANLAAKALASRPALVVGGNPQVRQLVRDIATGKAVIDSPLHIEVVSDNGMVQIGCVFAPRPIANLVAMSVTEVAPETRPMNTAQGQQALPDQRLSLQQIMELLRCDLMPPIHAALNCMRAATDPQPALADSLQNLTERLDRMVDLVDTFGEDVLPSNERVPMVDMVRSTCQELAELARSKGVTLLFKGETDDLPPICGSRRLLHRAVRECLHNAIVHARTEAPPGQPVGVELALRSMGQHLLLSIANMGVISSAQLLHHATSVFKPALLPDGKPDPAPPAMRIGLPLAHRILQLHGGRLRIEQDQDGGTGVVLELPCATARGNTHPLDMLQAQIFAEDLSGLLAGGLPKQIS